MEKEYPLFCGQLREAILARRLLLRNEWWMEEDSEKIREQKRAMKATYLL